MLFGTGAALQQVQGMQVEEPERASHAACRQMHQDMDLLGHSMHQSHAWHLNAVGCIMLL